MHPLQSRPQQIPNNLSKPGKSTPTNAEPNKARTFPRAHTEPMHPKAKNQHVAPRSQELEAAALIGLLLLAILFL